MRGLALPIALAAFLGGCAARTAARLAAPDEGARASAQRRYAAASYRDQTRIIDALLSQLADPGAETRLRTVRALRALAPLPVKANGALIEALAREKDPAARLELREAVAQAGAGVMAQAGRRLLRAGDAGRVDFEAIAVQLGASAAGPLGELLAAEDPVVRREVLRALGRLDAGKVLIARQVGLLGDADAGVRRQAEENISRLEAEPETVIALHQAPPGTWSAALALLRRSGRFFPETLVRGMSCGEDPSGREADDAYARVVALGAEVVPALSAAVRGREDCGRRACALEALCAVPAGRDEAARVLRGLLAKEDECRFRSKAAVLARRFPDHRSLFLPGLMAIFRDPSSDIDLTVTALGTLKSFGPPAREAVPLLQEFLKVPYLAGPAAEALMRIGGDPRRTFELMVAAQKTLFIDYSVFVPVGDAAVAWLEDEYRRLDPVGDWFQRERIEETLKVIASPAALEAWSRLERLNKEQAEKPLVIRCPLGHTFRISKPKTEWVACPLHPALRIDWRAALER